MRPYAAHAASVATPCPAARFGARPWSVLVLSLLAVGCAGEDPRMAIEAAEVFSPSRTGTQSPGIVELGQLLFFDPELSGNRDVACASCHMPVDHASDTLPLGIGVGASGTGHAREGGVVLPRHTLAPFNRSFARRLLWDGRVEQLDDKSLRILLAPNVELPIPEGIDTPLEAQALLPILDRHEMRGQDGDVGVTALPNELAAISDDDPRAVWDAVMVRLMAIDEYRVRFAGAFPSVPEGEHGIEHVARALARFEMRLWDLTDTPFDRYLGTEHTKPRDDAMSDSALRGATLFFGDAGCARCHNGPLLSDESFHNIGVPPVGPGFDGQADEGRARVTGEPADRFAFRTPSLRNVALTAPYFHNGSVPWLRDAVELHLDPERFVRGPTREGESPDPSDVEAVFSTLDAGARPVLPVSPEEIDDLVAFLEALSSDAEQSVFPGAGEPVEVPSGLAFPHSDRF
ncbi:MAG: cytochrome-c peroxidase [Sandaracinaceae bacterium]